MKTFRTFALACALTIAAPVLAQNQNLFIPNISNGQLGPFEPTTTTTNVVLPADGRLNFTRVHIPVGTTVRFIPNASNTPVYLLASEGFTNHGFIIINGADGNSLRGGLPGPGGFHGGNPGAFGSLPGDGLGPGAGRGDATTPGAAAYGSAPTTVNPLHGEVYGSRFLIPLVGGSGGGGSATLGGGGGGGALLIASSTHITNSGTVRAWGGTGSANAGFGSGGAVRLLAPVISGNGSIDVTGWNTPQGHGRISCEMIERSTFAMNLTPAGPWIVTTNFIPFVEPPNPPRLRVVSIAGIPIPIDAPAGYTVVLPLNAPANQTVVIEATGFGVEVDVDLRITPANGPALPLVSGTIDNATADPAVQSLAVTLPSNVPLTFNAWTR
jgi:hypothetical protein